MSNRSGAELFDMTAFRADVLAFVDRHGWSLRRLSDEAGVSCSGVMSWVRGERLGVGLLTAVALADVCDLALDAYRREYP